MKAWKVLVTSFVVTALLYGCEVTPARYKVLSFFFDGVPNPEEVKVAEIREKENKEIARTTGAGHAPYAAKMCDACHVPFTNALVVPISELCYRCHEMKLNKKWVHGPIASGGCRVCHDPHSSRYKFLLVSESESFCFYCHDEKAIMKNEAHKGNVMKCTSCHDAHMSDNRYLLKGK